MEGNVEKTVDSATEVSVHRIVDLIFNHFGGFTIMAMLVIITYVIYQSHKGHHLDWADLVKAKGTNNVSLTKFLQLIGGITGTWMVVYTTLHDRLTYDLLLVYLAYVGAIDGWSKFVSARYNPRGIIQPEIKEEPSPPVKEDLAKKTSKKKASE